MPDLASILAAAAVLVFIIATGVNLIAFSRHRKEQLGLALVLLIMAILSFLYTVGYGLIVVGAFSILGIDFNVMIFRPLVIGTGILFTVIPSWLVNNQDNIEMATKGQELRREIELIKQEKATVDQILEMCRTANKALIAENKALKAVTDE